MMTDTKKRSLIQQVIWFCLIAVLSLGLIQPAPAQNDAREDGLVINRSETKGTVENGLARFQMSLQVHSYSSEEIRTPLLPPNIAVTDWSVEAGFWGTNAYITRSNRGVELVLKDKGEYEVEIDFVVSVDKSRRIRSIRVPHVKSLIARTTVMLPQKNLKVTAQPETDMKISAEGGSTKVAVYGGEGLTTLSWQTRAPEKELKPVVFANQTMRVGVGRGVMRVNSTIDYSIVQGQRDSFQVRLPEGSSLLDIKGKHIQTWNVEKNDKGTRILQVDLTEAVKRNYALKLVLEKVLPRTDMEVSLPTIEPLNVVREKGQVAVSATSSIRVEAGTMKGISHIDVRKMENIEGIDNQELRLGFRYLKRPFSLSLRLGEVKAKTSLEMSTLVRAGKDTIRLNSQLNYTIRDAGVFQFKIRLSEGLRLVDITGRNINNWELDDKNRVLTVSLRSKAEGQYQLNVETESTDINKNNIVVPTIQGVDVEREVGYVGIVSSPGMKVETGDMSGLSQMDVEELPRHLRQQNPALGFRYIRPGYNLTINVSEIQPEVQAEVRTIYTLEEHELDVATEIHYSIRRAGIFQLRVAVPKELRRTNVQGRGIDDSSYDEEKEILTVNLRSKVKGDYVLTLGTQTTLDAPVKKVSLPVIKTLGTRKERGFLAVVAKSSVRVKAIPDTMNGLDEVGRSNLPPEMLRRAGTVALPFKYFSQPWELTLAVEAIQPRVSTEVFNLLTVGEELVSVSATARYSIANAGVDQVKVKVPTGATAVEFDGSAIKHREKGQENVWTISLQSEQTEQYTLYINFQLKRNKDRTVIPYGGVKTPGVHRETGYLTVTSQPDVELQVAGQDVQNLTPIDSREIPKTFTEGLQSVPLLLAYRYLSHPYTLRITALPHGAAEVTVAVVETARISTTITEEGNKITDLACKLRNTRQQYLDLKLPDGARIWHAFVDDQPVTPLRDEGLTKIPVAQQESGGNNIQEIRVRYSNSREKLGRMGNMRLDSPLVGIDVMRLGWTVSLPDDFNVVRESGTLREVDGIHKMERRLRKLNPDSKVTSRVRKIKSRSANMSQQAVSNVRAMQQSKTTGGSSTQRVAGYTGTRPREGATYVFQALIVSKGEPAWLQVTYLKSSIGFPLKGLLIALIVGLCGWMWRKVSIPDAGKLLVLYGAALMVLAIRTLLEGAYQEYLTVILFTLVVVATVGLLYTVHCWMRSLWRSWRSNSRRKNHRPTRRPQRESTEEPSQSTQTEDETKQEDEEEVKGDSESENTAEE